MDKPSPQKPGAAVCVFCGSSFGDDPAFRVAAEAIGSGIARMGYSLVFGGGGLGQMGVVAKATLDRGPVGRRTRLLNSSVASVKGRSSR